MTLAFDKKQAKKASDKKQAKKTSDKKQAKKTSDKKQAKKTSDKKQAKKTSDKKQAKKTTENMEKIRKYLNINGETKTSDIAEYIGLSLPRIRVILKEMEDVEAIGGNTNRKYRLKENKNLS